MQKKCFVSIGLTTAIFLFLNLYSHYLIGLWMAVFGCFDAQNMLDLVADFSGIKV